MTDRLKLYFADRDLVVLDVRASNPLIREFGVARVLQGASVIEDVRFRDSDKKDGRVAEFTLPPGLYEVRIEALGKVYFLGRSRFLRGARRSYSDAKLDPPHLFDDDGFLRIEAGSFQMAA